MGASDTVCGASEDISTPTGSRVIGCGRGWSFTQTRDHPVAHQAALLVVCSGWQSGKPF